MFRLYDKAMNPIPFPRGVTPLDILIPSIQRDRITDSIEGRSGWLNYGYTGRSRGIELAMAMHARDRLDYRLLRDEVYRMARRAGEFYIVEDVQPGKRYLVVHDDSVIPNRINRRVGEINLLTPTIELPYAESIGTTLDLHRDGASAEAALWGYGMGLIAEEGSTDYIHTGSAFRIYNAGDVEVHPFESYLRIVIDQVTGSTTDFRLSNVTTGDVFRYIEPLTGTLVLDGPNITRNDAAALGKTNRQFISLAPGWNEFTVEGASSARVSFDFRFLYQ